MWNVGRMAGFGSLLVVVVAMLPADVLAQKKKKDAKDDSSKYPAAADEDYGKLQKYVTGTIASFDSGGKSLTLRIAFPHQEANPNYKQPTTNPKAAGYNPQAAQQSQMWKAYNDLQIQQQRAANAKNPREAMQAQQRIAQDMARLQMQIAQQSARAGTKAYGDPNNQPFITVNSTKDYELEIEDKAPFRKTFLPLEYDDQGKIKTYTSEEKAALRADDKLYKAKIDEMANGQEVKLYLTIPKKKAKDADDKTPPERPSINKIVLTKDAPTVATTPDAPKKKKKNN